MTLRQLPSLWCVACLCLSGWIPTAWAVPASAPAQTLADDPAARDALLKAAGASFQIRQTPHFLVCYDTDRATVDRLTGRLEQTWTGVWRFCGQVGFELKPLSKRLEVIFFDKPDDYISYLSRLGFPAKGTYGCYFEGDNRSVFYNVENDPQIGQLHASINEAKQRLAQVNAAIKAAKSVDQIAIQYSDGTRKVLNRAAARREVDKGQRELTSLDRQRENYSENINRTVIQHEAAHQVLFNAGGHTRMATNPKWVVVGLACMFLTPPWGGGAGLAATNHARLCDLRVMMTAPGGSLPTSQGLLDAIKGDLVPSMRELVMKPELLSLRGSEGSNAYALSWGLAHYLQRARNKELGAYMLEIGRRKPNAPVTPDEELRLFEKHFGTVDEGLTRRFGDYIVKLPYRDPDSLR